MLGESVEYELVLFRRFMIRVAERLAESLGTQALALGDNLGQVASQTIENLATLTQVATLPLFRPLLTYEKQEIVDLAQKIGSYDISILPYKDCCAIMAKHPKTRSNPELVTAQEQALVEDYQQMVEQTLAEAVRLDFRCGQPVDPE
jgi:thiamine biosynthesis protein ThiI